MTDLQQPSRFPRSARYEDAWVRSLDMGPHPLWQLEELMRSRELRAGDRVLDVGCGLGASSVFLAREYGVHVDALDLWVTSQRIDLTARESGVGHRVTARQADVRSCDLAAGAYDAVVSIDAFEYFGTDARFLPRLLASVRPGGWIGMTTPCLGTDPYEAAPPAEVTAAVGWEAAAWHSPDWWRRHWQLTGAVDDVHAAAAECGRLDWLRWCRAGGEGPESPVVRMLESCADEQIGFAVVSARSVPPQAVA